MLTGMKKLFAPVDMTEGSPWKRIVAFTIPMLMGNVAQPAVQHGGQYYRGRICGG